MLSQIRKDARSGSNELGALAIKLLLLGRVEWDILTERELFRFKVANTRGFFFFLHNYSLLDARAYRATQDLSYILNSGGQNKENTEIKQYENPNKTVFWDI